MDTWRSSPVQIRTRFGNLFVILCCTFLIGAISLWAESLSLKAATRPVVPSALRARIAAPLFTAQPVSNTVAVEAQLSPATIVPGQEAQVTVTLRGQDLPNCVGVPGQPVDAVFVFDISDSAGNGADGSNWYATVQFTQELLAALAQPTYTTLTTPPIQSGLGIISSIAGVTGPEANILLDLTSDISQAATLLTDITPGGDSNIADGMRKAQELLTRAASGRRPLIFLMLHDNIPLSPAAITAAQEVRAQGTAIYLISNDLNIALENQITPALATEVTGEPAHLLANPQPGDLHRALLEASGGDLTAAARQLLIRTDFLPRDGLEITRVDNNGVIRNGEVIWELERLGHDDQIVLPYTIRAQTDAPTAQRELLIGMAYLDCNGYLQGADFAQNAPLIPASMTDPLVVGEVPTPAPTSTLPPRIAVPTLAAATTLTSGAPFTTTLISRQTISQTLCPGDAVTLALPVTISPRPARADILLAFDVSSSMDDILAAAATNGARIADELQQLIPDVQLGIVIFDDYPVYPFGEPGDTPYELLQPITSDNSALTRVFTQLPRMLQSGGDEPEAYTRLLYEAAEDPAIGWRPDARHFLIVFGDSYAREVDPGRDGSAGTSDDLVFEEVLEEVAEEAVTPLFASSNPITAEIWRPFITAIGGEVVLLEDANALISTISDLILLSGAFIDRLTITISPGYEQWLPADTVEMHDLDVQSGFSQVLDAVVRVPLDSYAGHYLFDLSAVGDGALYARWTVQTEVPASCAPLPPPPPPPPPPFPCDTWLWLWLLPILLPLLLLALWLLLRWLRTRGKPQPQPGSWRCWLPCLLALLLLLALGYLLGQRLARTVCIASETRASEQAVDIIPGSMGADGSRRVAVIVASGAFDLSSAAGDITFEEITLDQLNLATLANYDTLVLSQVCNISQQPSERLYAIVDWLGAGHKLIIYDADDCATAVDYHWLPFNFMTNNPGALGSTSGTLTVVTDEAMVAADPAHPAYIDPAGFAGIEIGDANVMVTQDLRWCGDIEAVNANAMRGYVHGYTFYEHGLIIYNGLDTDNIRAPGVYQLWQQELAQPWDSVNGRPLGLPCRHRVAGTVDLLAPIVLFDIPIPWWAPLLLLLLFWLFCYLGCRRRVQVKPIGTLVREPPPVRPYAPPPEPLGKWTGPPPVWNPEKTLIIGLGGTGRWTLTLIKKNLFDAGAGILSPAVRLLLVDNAPLERIGQVETDVSFAGVRLAEDEVLALGADLNDLIRELAKDAHRQPEMTNWFPAAAYGQRRESDLDLHKGVGGERPLGRAALFNDLQLTDGSQLWAALLEGISAIQEGEEARVIVVGSLAGGFGSAILADVAYLVRHAARRVGARHATVEAYLACQHTFDAVTTLQAQRELAANTFTTLQELRRFQLQGISFPYRIRYSGRHPGDPVWDGAMDRPLVDDLYLFDGYRPQRPLLRVQPVNGVFATMADVITLHLDRASRVGVGSLWEYRRQVQGESANQQRRTGQAVVSSAGTFAYRLPVYDLGELLKVRWAKHFLGMFLLGEAGGSLRLDTNLNREGVAESIQALAREFVRGMAGLGEPPRALLQLGRALDQRTFSAAEWTTEATAFSLTSLDAEEQCYQTYLVDALRRLLNGFSSSDLLLARSGKVGYALRWLELIEREWRAAEDNLQLLPGRLSGSPPANFASWQQLPPRYRTVTANVRSHLFETCAMISRELDPDNRGSWRSTQSAVYEQLLAREAELIARRNAMTALVTRRYFLDDQLLEQWYATYLANQVTPHIGRLYWQPTPDQRGVDLVFNGLATPQRLRQDSPAQLTEALLAVAAYLAQDIWSKETLATYLTATDLHPENIHTTADEMWAASAPLLHFDPGTASDLQAMAVLGVNQSVRNTAPLEQRLAFNLPSTRQIRRLEITDPYTMLVARFNDVIPADATTPYRDAAQIYRAQLEAGAMTGQRVVFPAERNALVYAQRLPEINQAPRLFHPLFVAALEDEGKAILFAQVWAAGLVRSDYQGNQEIRVVDTNDQPYPLFKAEERGLGRLSQNLVAMLNFVAAPDRILTSVAARLETISNARDRWLAFVERDLPALSCSMLEGDRDLAAFADLVLYDLLQNRRQR